MSPLKIGFVSLGQGPRPDLESLHERLFTAYGLNVVPVWEHILDGLTEAVLPPAEEALDLVQDSIAAPTRLETTLYTRHESIPFTRIGPAQCATAQGREARTTKTISLPPGDSRPFRRQSSLRAAQGGGLGPLAAPS